MNREDIELYVMGQYDGDVAALERAIAEDPALAQLAAEEAQLEVLLRDAAAAATFCAACDDLVRGTRCDACGAAVKPGGYTVERVLVSNAHGRMYVARDADGKRVALKELAFVQAPSPAALAAFEREAKFLRALEHPAIPRFLASFEEGSGVHTRYYLAQELVEGTSLDRLDDHWYAEAEITVLARQVLEVLVYLQSLSPMVIHRDIKPANLVRRADGSIALVDFGAAHVHGTTAGITTIGTFGYMPIEQLAGLVDATTDGYALGMTLLHLLTRQEPWKLAQQRATVNVSAPLRAFLDRLTAVDPKDRFASAKDALAALTSPAAVKASVPPRRGRSIAIAAVATCAFAAVGGGVFALAHRTHHPAAPPPRGLATLRVNLPDGVTAKMLLDNVMVGTVARGQEIPVVAGNHHVQLVGDQGQCVVDVNAAPGTPSELMCALPKSVPPPKLHNDKKVTWSLEHVKLHDFVLLAAETCGFNAVIADNIDSATTVNIKDAPCDQAFEVVLGSLGLGYAFDPTANLLWVAPTHELEAAGAKAAAGVVFESSLPDGAAVDLDLKDADLRDALKMLIAGSGSSYNLVVPDDIHAKVTIRLEKAPWNHAFEAVLASHGLWYRYRENGKLILIGPRHEFEEQHAR